MKVVQVLKPKMAQLATVFFFLGNITTVFAAGSVTSDRTEATTAMVMLKKNSDSVKSNCEQRTTKQEVIF